MCAVDRPIYRKGIIPASVVHRIYKTKQDLHDHLEKSCKSCLRFELVKSEALDAAEATLRRLHDPTDHAGGVVAITEDVITRRQTMLRALALHLIELLHVKLVIADDAPIVCRGVHRETRSKRSIRSNDERILTST